MASPNQGAIETFMSITGVSEPTAIQKLEEHHGNLNEAVNAHFSAGERNTENQASFVASRDDVMDIDDPIEFESRRPPSSLLPSTGVLNRFRPIDPNFTRNIHDTGTDFTSRPPLVSNPREVRQIPIEVKDGNGPSVDSSTAPTVEHVTGSAHIHGPEVRGTVIIDDDDDNGNKIPTGSTTLAAGHHEKEDAILGGDFRSTGSQPSAPIIVNEADYNNDIEEEMVRAAIEASKQDAAISEQSLENHHDVRDPMPQPRQSHLEDAELAHAVSLSMKMAEQEKALREGNIEKLAEMEALQTLEPSSGRLDIGSSSIQDETEEEELPLVRQRSRNMSRDDVDTTKGTEGVEVTAPSSQHDNLHQPQQNGSNFPSDEWGGISSEEHDEAVMLEAAMFGGIPERSAYNFPYAPHQLIPNDLDRSFGPYQRHIPRPPSPSLAAQRLIREQQDDEFLAALQADREKELKAREEAEAAFAKERETEKELLRRQAEEQELERHLAAKAASLPQEPAPDDENAVTLLVRMPDGNRMGRRFLKLDKLQHLFDFIDVGRVVKPGSYRLVRPYPRHAFGDGESTSTLNELGLTSKQEALYLETI